MRLPKTAAIATGFILPLFTIGLLIAAQPATHAKPQHHTSLKPATSTSQVKGDSTAQITTSPTTTQVAQATYGTTGSRQLNTLTQTPVPSATNNTTPSTPTVAQAQTSNSNQVGNEQTVELHIGGYPPATGAVLTPDFENPVYVPGDAYPQYPNPHINTSYPLDSYEWVATKYCVYTYADGHTFQQAYQYLAYSPAYANPDGSLNPSGINMAITSTPTYSCDIAHAPKSAFEPNYTY